MFVPFHGDVIISQFEGYEQLAELDWDGYPRRYGNIQRLDLILEAENDSANRYKASKQADVLMAVTPGGPASRVNRAFWSARARRRRRVTASDRSARAPRCDRIPEARRDRKGQASLH
jgi:hypothetical protein